jgi:hypothetical protein
MKALVMLAVLTLPSAAAAAVTEQQIGQWAKDAAGGSVDCPMALEDAEAMHKELRAPGTRASLVNAIGCSCNAWAMNPSTLLRYSTSECGLNGALKIFEARTADDEKLAAWGKRLLKKKDAALDQLSRREALKAPAERLKDEDRAEPFQRMVKRLEQMKADAKAKRFGNFEADLAEMRASLGLHERGLSGLTSKKGRSLVDEAERLLQRQPKGSTASARASPGGTRKL